MDILFGKLLIIFKGGDDGQINLPIARRSATEMFDSAYLPLGDCSLLVNQNLPEHTVTRDVVTTESLNWVRKYEV